MIRSLKNIYENQPLIVILDAGETGQLTPAIIATATPSVIVYDNLGVMTTKAVADGVTIVAGTTQIRYKFPGGILKLGTWQVQANVVLSGDTYSIPGEEVVFDVIKREKK